jgi:hypothetical protein
MATMLKGAKKTSTKAKAKAPKTARPPKEHLGPNDDKSDLAIADRVGVTITAPNFKTVEIVIRGTAPYVQLAFGKKAREMMREKQAAGSTAAKGRKREAKDFEANFKEAQHRSTKGWCGIPASALRNALVDSCVVVGYHKTKAKKAIFVEADGFDAVEGTPLIHLYADGKGKLVDAKPKHVEHTVRNATGVADIRVRAMFESWRAKVRVRFDADMFTPADIANLMLRAGMQVGIGEGRADSPNSCGMGWGHFECVKG